MDDKCIMENLLLTEKGVCDLYVHGTIESSTVDVHQTFNQALNDSLCMQDDIYKQMSAKGWYQTAAFMNCSYRVQRLVRCTSS